MSKRQVYYVAIAALALLIAVPLWAGHILSSPRQVKINKPKNIAPFEEIQLNGGSGNTIAGWYLPSVESNGSILLLHGVRANRQSMLGRSRFLRKAGYSVLLIDFQGHGESIGERITFGYRESEDVVTSYQYLKERNPDLPIGVIGVSLGGAATLLSSVAEEINALVIEAVYPTIDEAIANRLAARLGSWSRHFTPLFTWQFPLHIDVGSEWLRPIDAIANIRNPILIVAGTEDKHTLLSESVRMYENTGEPKELWKVEGAGHENYYRYAPEEYEHRILQFFADSLKSKQSK